MTASFGRRRFIQLGSSVSAALIAAACKVRGGSQLESQNLETEFDFIIVGSGAGGGPLAVNLSKAGYKTLLLEAGSDQGNRGVYQIPAFHPISSEDPEMSWDFFVKHFDDDAKDAEDQKYDKSQKGILYPRAGTLGGCTSHNAMITVYPNASDWDRMAEDVGDRTYNSKTMREYFKLVEDATYQKDPSRKRGWLQVRFASSFLVIGDRAVKAVLFAAARSLRRGVFKSVQGALDLLKLVTLSDTNDPAPERDTSEGLALVPLAVNVGHRRRCVRDYILESANTNLVVRTNCFVTNLTFQGDTDAVVTGVEYVKGAKVYKASKSPRAPESQKIAVKARKEVILAGGTFNTPQLLMLSGIGPKDELESFVKEDPKFKIRLDRPGVGKNLQDRYEVGVVNATTNKLDIIKECKFQENVTDACYNDWKENLTGPYTSNGGIVAILKKSVPSLTNPDLFMFLLPSDFRGYRTGYSQTIARGKNYLTWAILKAHTHNKAGYVKLKTLSPFDRPEINFRYFEDGTDERGEPVGNAAIADLEAVVTGVQFIRNLMADADKVQDVLSQQIEDVAEVLGAPRTPYFQEVCPGPVLSTRDRLREWVRRNSWGHHACGTCKMGRESDPMAVVDSKFQVIGAKNLRVVDASIFARIPGYFIVSSIYTISERATDEIIETNGGRRRIAV